MLDQFLDGSPNLGVDTFLLLLVLVALEAVLSADNAIALASISKGLEDAKLQRQALNFGLIIAFVLRITLILTATWVIQYWQFELAGALYLLWLVFQHFSSATDSEGEHHGPRFVSLWQAIPVIALTDLAFSLDSVTTAIAISDETWLVLTGATIGIITLRWSFGGLVAFEMAQQLLAAGDEVALLAVLDTLAPVSVNKPSFWDGCKFILTTVSRSIWPFVVDYFRLVAAAGDVQAGGIVAKFPKLNKLLNFAANLLHGWNWKQAVMVSILSQESKERSWRELAIPSMFTVFQANSQATLSYVPKVYPHRITLFRSGEQLSMNHQDPTLGWRELTAQKVEVIKVPGNHLTMLRKPWVEVLAQQLKQCLDRELSD